VVPGDQGDEVIEFLASVPLFGELPRHLLGQIRTMCQSERLLAGEWLFRQEDKGDALFVVRTGRVEVIREQPGPPEVLVVAGPGAALGELSILSGRPRAASARAIRDCELLRLDRDVLLEMLGVSPDLAAGLLRILGQHLRAVGNAAGQRYDRRARPISRCTTSVRDCESPSPTWVRPPFSTGPKSRRGILIGRRRWPTGPVGSMPSSRRMTTSS
jgi:CRP/FNR family cyclic AMP-dependent transcriptional regulator